ncbi:MAG: hypothetical protein KF785_09165 [Gemmatimonadales bacterium]|nr:hypothetical protein [Gemmatimonadales bacterium]
MTGPNPLRQDIGSAKPVESMPDPWGVRRAENLLTTLEGVLSARVVTTPLGEVSEIHVLAQSGLQPKQLVRNIESALLAQLGLKVDHRKISIAQTAEVRPMETIERASVRERAMQRGVLFEDLVVRGSDRPLRVVVQVSLSIAGRQEAADEETTDTPRGRVEGAARATVSVLQRLLEKHSLMVENVQVVEAADRSVVFVALQGMGGRDGVLLTGTAEIRQSPERAAVFAVLDATNRWVDARRPA